MSDASAVMLSGQGLRDHVEAGDWDRADRELQYLVGAWQRARLRGDDATELASLVDDLRMRVVTGHDLDQTVGPAQFAWMLAGVCSVLSQAVTPAEVVGGDVVSRILDALDGAEAPLPTKELAERIERSAAATARALPRLREEGLTTELSAGRQTMNGITAKGRERAAATKEARLRFERAIQAGPTSIARSPVEQIDPIDMRDIKVLVEPNDVRSVRRATA